MHPPPVAQEAAAVSLTGNSLLASRLLEASALGLLVVTPLLMNVAGVRTFEAMKLAGATPLAAAMAFCLITLAWSGQVKTEVSRIALCAFGAWLVCAIAATLFSEMPWTAFYGEYFRREGLLSWLIYAAMFIGLLVTLRQRAQAERVIDAILVASVAPCAYAMMQRFGFDFFETGGLASGETSARPGANLGNPTFLSAYLLIVIPLTFARAADAFGNRLMRAAFVALGLVQLIAAILTQSRGPLLGLVIALFLFAVSSGARLRKKVWVWGAVALVCVAVAAVTAININPAAQSAAWGTPLQRFIIIGGQDLTSLSRVGIWQAGVDAFHQLPVWRQVIGSGPETAYLNYFAHLSPTVLRIEGYAETIDRLHSETMESIMTFGVAGWLAQVMFFSTLVWMVAARCAAWSTWRPALVFAGMCVSLSALSGLALVSFGHASAFLPIGLGLGVGIAWSLTMLEASRRMFCRVTHLTEVRDDLLLLAMCSALIGSWIESQVGVPTITTRLMLATYGALILLLTTNRWGASTQVAAKVLTEAWPANSILPKRKGGKKHKPQPQMQANTTSWRSAPAYTGWMTGLALIACTAGYFPPLLGSAIHGPAVYKLHLILIPLLAIVVGGGIAAWHEARRTETPAMDAMPRFLLWFSIPWMVFALTYVNLGRAIPAAGEMEAGDRINALLMLGFGSYALMAGLRSLVGTKWQLRGSSYLWFAVVIAITAGVFWAAMLDVRADAYMKLGNWAQQRGKADTQASYLQRAALIAPYERRYSSAYAASLIEQSAQALSKSQGPDAALQEILKKLVTAEQNTEKGVLLAPRDPWMSYAHANAHQFMALGFFSPFLAAGERDRHIRTAQDSFAKANAQFPAHPWILRNWAQLQYELGNKPAAYAKFDQMEKLDPLNISVYSDRARIATVAGDDQIAIASLEKGISNQPAGSSGQIQLKSELARAHLQLGNAQRALLLWGEMTRADPLNFDAAGGMIEAYGQLGQREMALKIVQDVLGQLRSMPATRQNRATKAKIESLAAQIAGSARKR